jgi:hypothetical protein
LPVGRWHAGSSLAQFDCAIEGTAAVDIKIAAAQSRDSFLIMFLVRRCGNTAAIPIIDLRSAFLTEL